MVYLLPHCPNAHGWVRQRSSLVVPTQLILRLNSPHLPRKVWRDKLGPSKDTRCGASAPAAALVSNPDTASPLKPDSDVEDVVRAAMHLLGKPYGRTHANLVDMLRDEMYDTAASISELREDQLPALAAHWKAPHRLLATMHRIVTERLTTTTMTTIATTATTMAPHPHSVASPHLDLPDLIGPPNQWRPGPTPDLSQHLHATLELAYAPGAHLTSSTRVEPSLSPPDRLSASYSDLEGRDVEDEGPADSEMAADPSEDEDAKIELAEDDFADGWRAGADGGARAAACASTSSTPSSSSSIGADGTAAEELDIRTIPIMERRCPSKRRGGHGSGRDVRLTNRARKEPYALKESQMPAALALELREFEDFSLYGSLMGARAGGALRKVTLDGHVLVIRQALGWLHLVQGVPLEELRLGLLVPETTRAGARRVQQFLIWQERERGIAKRSLSHNLAALIQLTKFLYQEHAQAAEGDKPYSNLEVVRVLRTMYQSYEKMSRVSSHVVDSAAKWLDWPDYLAYVAELRRECAGLDARGRPRKPLDVAMSLQAYLIAAILSCVPDRQRTLRELMVGRTLVKDNNGIWSIRHTHADYKTGDTYGERPPLVIDPSLYYELEEFINTWRAHLNPQHNFLFSKRDGSAGLTVQELSRSFSLNTYRLTGRKINPHMVRDMVVTYARSGHATEHELEALAAYMGHSLAEQRGTYDRRTKAQKVQPALGLLAKISGGAWAGAGARASAAAAKLAPPPTSMSPLAALPAIRAPQVKAHAATGGSQTGFGAAGAPARAAAGLLALAGDHSVRGRAAGLGDSGHREVEASGVLLAAGGDGDGIPCHHTDINPAAGTGTVTGLAADVTQAYRPPQSLQPEVLPPASQESTPEQPRRRRRQQQPAAVAAVTSKAIGVEGASQAARATKTRARRKAVPKRSAQEEGQAEESQSDS